MRRASSNTTWVTRCPGKQGICKVMQGMNVYSSDGGDLAHRLSGTVCVPQVPYPHCTIPISTSKRGGVYVTCNNGTPMSARDTRRTGTTYL